MNEPIHFREASAADRDAILALGAAAFGTTDAYKRERDFWLWEFQRGYAGEATVFVAGSGTRIVGHIAFIPQHYTTPAGPALAALAVDAMVHPEFHRRGVFSGLTKYAAASLRERFSFALALQIRKSSLGGMLAGGWEVVDRLPVLLKPLSLRNLARDFGLPVPQPSASAASSPHIEPIGAAELAQLARSSAMVMQQPRSREFAQWRYVDRPRAGYRIDGWFDGRELRAAVVHRSAVLKGVRTLAIVDAVAAPGAESALQMLVSAICRADKGNSLAAALLTARHPARSILRRCGFFSGPYRFNLLAQVFDPAFSTVLQSPWSLSWADTDHL